jgi:hypothetical protein
MVARDYGQREHRRESLLTLRIWRCFTLAALRWLANADTLVGDCVPLDEAENLAQYIAFVASVDGMLSSLEAIEAIGRALGEFTMREGWETMIMQGDLAGLTPDSTKYQVVVREEDLTSGLTMSPEDPLGVSCSAFRRPAFIQG